MVEEAWGFFAAITVGDEPVGPIVPKECSLLPAGPQGACNAARLFADNPTYLRLLGLARIDFGIRPAPRQYREE